MFKPMLAATIKDANTLKFPLYASPKYDGIRAIVLGGQLLSRNLKPIPNIWTRNQFEGVDYEGFDGELIVGEPNASNVFNRTSSGVMSVDGEPPVRFFVFDKHDENIGFVSRQKMLWRSYTRESTPCGIVWVSQRIIQNTEELLAYEISMLEEGYEGVMLRDPEGQYKFGRSTLREGYLMKLKRFEDSEAEVLGFVEQMSNDNEATRDALGRTKRTSHKANKHGKDTLGALKVRDLKTRVEFEIGTGFTDELREEIWALKDEWLDKIIKYKHQPSGVKDKPRFPVYVGVRYPNDL